MPGCTTIPFIVCAGVGAFLNAVPLPKAIASGNVGTSMLIVWTELACLVQFANAIRWNGNITDWAPLWCDFCGRFLIAADVALVGAGVSINRRLYMIVTLDPRRRQKAFNVIVDIALCLVIPLVAIALEYVVQQYRYYIFENVGCLPGVGSIDLAFPLVWLLPLVIGAISAGYACRTIHANLKRNSKVMEELGASLAWSRRLMAIAVLSVLYGLVPTSMAIALAATAYPVTSWPGWKAVHSTIDDVAYIPAREWQSNSTQIACTELRRWTIVSLAFVVFFFLGLTSDMKKRYWAPFRGVSQIVSANRAGSIPWQHVSEDLGNHEEEPSNSVYVSSDETLAERQRSHLGLVDRSGLETDLDSLELGLPQAATRSIPLRKLQD